MDVRSITTPSFPVLSRSQGLTKGNQPAEEGTKARESQDGVGTRHPALTAEEQRFFESAFPAPAQEAPPKPTYSGGGAMKQQMRSGSIVDRKV